MTEKEMKNKDSVKELPLILLAAPVVSQGNAENKQSGSIQGIESGSDFTEDALEEYEIPRAYSQCC